MRIRWRDAPYNKQLHLAVERQKRTPHTRYLIRQWRRMAKLGAKGAIPIDLPFTGGQIVTRIEQGKATGVGTYIGSDR